jgi:malonyl-CoA/methylmalonyl-CoA synthetase
LSIGRSNRSRNKKQLSRAAKRLRLFVSGSAALPIPLFEQWQQISGHKILERYGMSETGMILSNPYKGKRQPGTVGLPLPGVEVSLRPSEEDEETGEIMVKSPAMFRCYWQNQSATEESFLDGWFMTGDIATCEKDTYRILGRASVDIIKSGGFKISALEVENVLLGHASIAEVAVVGVEDPVWGERVGALIVENPGNDITPGWIKGWAGRYLAPYKLPTVVVKVNKLPRNAMGKVNKAMVKEVIKTELELQNKG